MLVTTSGTVEHFLFFINDQQALLTYSMAAIKIAGNLLLRIVQVITHGALHGFLFDSSFWVSLILIIYQSKHYQTSQIHYIFINHMLFFVNDLSQLLKQNENKEPCKIIAFLILLTRITLRIWTLLLVLLLPPLPLLLPPLPLILLQPHLPHLSARCWWFGPVSNSIACKVLLLLTYLPTLRLHEFLAPLIY